MTNLNRKQKIDKDESKKSKKLKVFSKISIKKVENKNVFAKMDKTKKGIKNVSVNLKQTFRVKNLIQQRIHLIKSKFKSNHSIQEKESKKMSSNKANVRFKSNNKSSKLAFDKEIENKFRI